MKRNPTLKEIRDKLDEYIKENGDKELRSVGTCSGSSPYAFQFYLSEIGDRYMKETGMIGFERKE